MPIDNDKYKDFKDCILPTLDYLTDSELKEEISNGNILLEDGRIAKKTDRERWTTMISVKSMDRFISLRREIEIDKLL